MARVKYLGKSKHSFAVNVKGVEYKFKPDKMSHLEMPEDHAAVLVASAPKVWEVESTAAVEAAPAEWTDIGTSGYDPAATEADAPTYKRRGKYESD